MEEALSKDSSRSHRHLLHQYSHSSSSSQAQLRPAVAAAVALKEVKREERTEMEQETLVALSGGKASSQSEEDSKQQRRGVEEGDGGETTAMTMPMAVPITKTAATTTVVGPSKNGGQSEWTNLAVSSLLDLYSEKFASGKGCLRVKDWEEVVHFVNSNIEGPRNYKTLKQCRDKVDSLKRRYKIEKKKANDFGVGAVSWPFFAQLDRMMRAPPMKPARAIGIDGGGVKLDTPPSSRLVEKQPLPYRYDNHHPSMMMATNTTTATGFASSLHHQKGKSIQPSDDSDDSNDNDSDEEEDPEPPLLPPNRNRIEHNNYDNSNGSDDSDGYSTPSCSERNLSSKDCTSGLVDKDSGRRRHCLGFAGKRTISKKQRAKRNHPIQALANAVIGFADVFARIEMAKVEIVTKMKIELAKLKQRRKKRRDSSSLSSESD